MVVRKPELQYVKLKHMPKRLQDCGLKTWALSFWWIHPTLTMDKSVYKEGFEDEK